jgi:hypothetical protein
MIWLWKDFFAAGSINAALGPCSQVARQARAPDTSPGFSSPDQAARRLDDLLKTPGDLEIA